MDPDSNFCKANYRWATQQLLRYGALKQAEVPTIFQVNGEYPKCFQVDKLKPLRLEQITWFDESHKKQHVGKMKNDKKIQMRFRRNADGKLDPNGELCPKGYEVGMKFSKEARFCFGAALQIDANGDVVTDDKNRPLGKTLPLFEYTNSMIVTNTEWLKVFTQTMKTPQSLKNARAPWVENMREPGVIYSGDPIDRLPKLGSTMKKLMADHNVNTVEEFFSYFNCRVDRRKAIVKSVKGLSMETLLKAEAVAEKAPKGPPPSKDHQKAKNPYFS
jgi:hypothetical protein